MRLAFLLCFLPWIVHAQWTYDPTSSIMVAGVQEPTVSLGMRDSNTYSFLTTNVPFEYLIAADGSDFRSNLLGGVGGFCTENGVVYEDGVIVIASNTAWIQGVEKHHLMIHKMGVDQNDIWNKNNVLSTAEAEKVEVGVQTFLDDKYLVYWFQSDEVTDHNIYAQRVSKEGEAEWNQGGKVICSHPSVKRNLEVFTFDGGAMFIWEDYRDGTAKIYGQRITSIGFPLWETAGRELISMNGFTEQPQVHFTGENDFYIVFNHRLGSTSNLRVARFDLDGQALWSSKTVSVSSPNSNQTAPSIIDYQGDLAIFWEDDRNELQQIYYQVIDSNGAYQLSPEGRQIASESGSSKEVTTTSDRHGGIVAVWSDARNDLGDIYLQHIDSTGDLMYGDTGLLVNNEVDWQYNPHALVNDRDELLVIWSTTLHNRGNLVNWAYDEKPIVPIDPTPYDTSTTFLSFRAGVFKVYPNPITAQNFLQNGITLVDPLDEAPMKMEIFQVNAPYKMVYRKSFEGLLPEDRIQTQTLLESGVYNMCFIYGAFKNCQKVVVVNE